MRGLHLRAWAVAVACAFAGCSVVNAPSDHQTGPVPADQFCSYFADILCSAYEQCCSMPSVTYDDCRTAAASKCADEFGSIALDPRAGYDPEVAAEVLAEGHALASQCSTAITVWFSSRSGFQRVLTGTHEGGETCTPDDLTDYPAYFSCKQLNQACVFSSGSRWVCTDLRSEGDDCYGDQDCMEGLWCEGSVFFTKGTCSPKRPADADCPRNEACQTLVCDETATDGGATGVCANPSQDAVYCGFATFL